jgi:hypothetical protein
VCALPSCKRSIDHKRPQARWCDARCANTGWHLARREAARNRRARCIVCGDPIRYGANGVRLTARTCGKTFCRAAAYRWFGKMTRRRAA